MRWVRAALLVALLGAGTCVVVAAAVAPVLEGWEALAGTQRPEALSAARQLEALLVGGCACVLALAWLWLVAAVGACTWEALRADAAPSGAPPSGLLRPRLVRALVATCLGATALAGPAAGAGPARSQVTARPGEPAADPVPAAASPLALLDGLPVPDRPTGRWSPAARRTDTVGRVLVVTPGDSLWSLTADLLPPDSSADTVATGWRLLYAANRGLVGPDPDLVHPGQRLRVGSRLEALVSAARADRVPVPGPHAGRAR